MLKIIKRDKIIKLKLKLKWILLFGFLGIMAGTANWADEIHNFTASVDATPAYTLKKLTNDENTVLYWTIDNVSGFYLQRSKDFPEFDGIKYVDSITDTSAKVGFDSAINADQLHYLVYVLNPQGTWVIKNSDLGGSPTYTWRYLTIQGLEPDSWQTVRVVMARHPRNAEGGRSDYNQVVARFKTKPSNP